jgi:hypothetical protein
MTQSDAPTCGIIHGRHIFLVQATKLNTFHFSE